jgi:hypothetical protein
MPDTGRKSGKHKQAGSESDDDDGDAADAEAPAFDPQPIEG